LPGPDLEHEALVVSLTGGLDGQVKFRWATGRVKQLARQPPSGETGRMFSDADAAELYDTLNPWDGNRFPADAFYDELVTASGSVLDVGCGTGAMLHRARERGHRGRLVGIDPDLAALERARRRDDVEWIAGTAAEIGLRQEFELATMVSHAFQCLVGDDELRRSLKAVRGALADGGCFAFETRHPQAKAWQDWNPAEVTEIAGLRMWHEVESVEDYVVTFTETTARLDGSVLRVDRTALRFLDVAPLNAFLTEAGFEVTEQYGDWQRGPLTSASREIVTIARRVG
jgi:SAM-dependent methyltransferase